MNEKLNREILKEMMMFGFRCGLGINVNNKDDYLFCHQSYSDFIDKKLDEIFRDFYGTKR